MNLSLGNSSSNGASEGYCGHGVYVDDAKIVSVTDVTNDEKENRFNQDINIKLELEIQKNGWTKIVSVGGNYQRDSQTGEITNWGGAFKTKDLYEACGLEDSDMDMQTTSKKVEGFSKPVENLSPSDDMILKMVGQSVLALTYTKKDGGYSTWNSIGSPTRDKEAFASYFKKNHQKSGYPSNYEFKDGNSGPSPSANIVEAVNSASPTSL